MRKVIVTIGLFILCTVAKAQIEGTSLPSLPSLTTAEMNGAIGVYIGSSIFNTNTQKVYRFTSTGWVTNTDNQDASEVLSDNPVDVDGDGDAEANVEEMIQSIAPITAASGRIFYPPSIAIDASVTGSFTVDLYQAYYDQFASPVVSSEAVPIPVYTKGELYYYVTEADIDVFGDGSVVQNMSVNDNGVLSYQIFNSPVDYNSLINVVFVVK
ncbi:hypothetical protein [Maribacter antarcticus]|uniref:hypothetical protein n=1 Tax=Maribacter antarcticus TaxID=505250 RepID=UPI0006889B14|nr:hypothetical protein [Maribacter antarcticus]